jgi:acetyltransferase-like isoleucine patch superfamily enzyme
MLISTIYKAISKINRIIISPFYPFISKLLFYLNDAKIGKGLQCNGIPKVIVTRRGKLIIGENFKFNSGNNHNVIGRQQKCIFWVDGKLSIGNNVGISATSIICNHEIIIGNNVMIGGNTVIYDTDFHSLDPKIRGTSKDKQLAKKRSVIIKDNVFIGAHSTILKGVTIGENSIIGACSVVSKDIPPNEIWAGNPAKFIKKINY